MRNKEYPKYDENATRETDESRTNDVTLRLIGFSLWRILNNVFFDNVFCIIHL